VFQYTRKSGAGTIKARQVVPGMHWEVVPSPVVEVRIIGQLSPLSPHPLNLIMTGD